jgi:hypothetical protein
VEEKQDEHRGRDEMVKSFLDDHNACGIRKKAVDMNHGHVSSIAMVISGWSNFRNLFIFFILFRTNV